MTKRTKLYLGAATLLGIAAIGYGLFQLSKSRDYQLFGTLVSSVKTTDKIVALTFDDAPGGQTDKVLSILQDQNIKATFYVIGQNAQKDPTGLKAIADQGHELGNHSYSHQRMALTSPWDVSAEVEKTNALIRASGYTGEITFRPPYGKKLFTLPWYLWQHNITTVMWNVEPDTYNNTASGITDYTLKNTTPGSIIVMHPFCGTTCAADREALPKIIQGLKDKGYQFVTINQLLQKRK
jgi:peptidoglycan/xylan/chitin deacetylase (PgdA/CDA1 family)